MRAAVAIGPVIETSPGLDLFDGTIRQFQMRGFQPSFRIISIVHAGLYLVPRSWNAEDEERYIAEAFIVVFFIVAISVVFQGMSIPWVASRLNLMFGQAKEI